MDWGIITERDYQFEKEYGFSPDIDYIKEVEEYNRVNSQKDWEGRQKFNIKHNGSIAFWGKVFYYQALKKAGLI